ncbi:MAG: 4Fe-4S binding protein [Burkholderiales bacterium]|nr:4Fe-4S binding protein [Burkholderiales bacterium]
MHSAPPFAAGSPASRRTLLARLGDAMRRHSRVILGIQCCVLLIYLTLLIVPALLPLPPEDAHIYDNLRLFAQCMFWGVWWPFVMLATMLFGRVWCGVFCPEGALTEFASRHGLGRPIPRWIRWSGWPLLAFVCTTVYGQLVSVYEYPEAALLVLGGSSLVALAVGFMYGKGKRVWCRYLCPANGVFSLLAKIAPLHFRVDEAAWKLATAPAPRINCAPLIDIRHMKSASACHACGRCSGQKGAVQLALRSPAQEILQSRNQDVKTEEILSLTLGVIGVASAAFLWSSSPWFVTLKTAAADWLIERDWFLLLQDNAPWWLLTHYPAANDVFTWLDGLCILAYILGGGLVLGGTLLALVALAARVAGQAALSWQRLALALVPVAGMGIFLGLSMLTLSHLKAERIVLSWVPQARALLLLLGTGFSLWLGGKMLVARFQWRSLCAFAVFSLAPALIAALWSYNFFV